jgi:4-hydroxymandelate oxidase
LQLLERDQLASIITLDDFEYEATNFTSHTTYEYVIGGAGADLTVRANRTAFERIRLNPRVLIDVSSVDTRLKIFGREHEFPILLAPTGYHKLLHADAELETIKGANEGAATLVAAAFANVTVEAMAAATARPLWFQVYLQTDREFTKELIDRAVASGCEAVCITVDVPVNGPRDRELRAGFRLPPGTERANLAKLGNLIATASHRPSGRNIYSAVHGPDATWKDIDWLRSIVPVKLLLKGILHPEDAELAQKAGCDGVIVSNHGGRSLDSVSATIDALPPIVDRVGRDMTVLLDGGVRRGIDVFKALAKGASAVLIGRPYLYGLAVGGANGVARVIEILRTELEMTMGLVGCPSLSQISSRFLLP